MITLRRGGLLGQRVFRALLGPGIALGIFAGSPGETCAGGVTTLATFDYATNGGFSSGGVALDAEGNLYGTTTQGGATGLGTVWEVAAGSGTITTIASFSGVNQSNPIGG